MHIAQRAGAALSLALVASTGLALAPAGSAATPSPGTAAKGKVRSAATASSGRTTVGTVVTRSTYYPSTTIRSTANLSSRSVGTLTQGQTVTGTVSGSWLQLVTPSQYAGKYVSLSVLSDQAPPTGGCLSNDAHVTLGTGYPLCAGTTGVKVQLVREAMGLRADSSVQYGTFDRQTSDAVRRFQQSHHLYPNGQVDRTTYTAMQKAFPGKRIAKFGYDVDGWVNGTSPSLPAHASSAQRIQAMLDWAYTQQRVNRPYIWGGTGPFGYDCSGFVLQAMRAGGRSPENVSNWTDVRPASDLSRQMWADPEFAKGSLSAPKPGDFVYYGSSKGVVGHVAIYIGRNTVINAVGNKVQFTSYSSNLGWAKKVGINRAF